MFACLFLLISVLVGSSAEPQPDGPFVIINKRPDEMWLLPLAAIRDEGRLKVVTIVDISRNQPAYSKADELAEMVESDSTVEIDCGKRLMRATSSASFDLAGRKMQRGGRASAEWQPLPVVPPFLYLRMIVCERRDVSAATRSSLRQAIPKLRAELDY